MTDTAQRLLEEVMRLPADEREWIVESVWGHSEISAKPAIEEAWTAEVNRRMAEIDSGTVQLVSHEEAMRRIRSRLR